MTNHYREVGIVKALYRYPVKSMSGEEICETKLGWHGLDGDRRYAFVRANNITGFPWLTAREVPELILYKPCFSNPADIRHSSVLVKTPNGENLPVSSDKLLSEINQLYGHQAYLMQLWSGIFDAMDLSLLTAKTLDSLSEMVGFELEVQRFRPNIFIEAYETRPFPEDKWIGKTLIFGDRKDSGRIRVNRKDVRCMVVNIDLETAKQNPVVLKEIVSKRKNLVGVYGTTHWPGTIKVGDIVRLCG